MVSIKQQLKSISKNIASATPTYTPKAKNLTPSPKPDKRRAYPTYNSPTFFNHNGRNFQIYARHQEKRPHPGRHPGNNLQPLTYHQTKTISTPTVR
jgi:hypothetical protein